MKIPTLAIKRFWDKNAPKVFIVLCLALGFYFSSLTMENLQNVANLGRQIETYKVAISVGEKRFAETCAIVFPGDEAGKRIAKREEFPLFIDALITSLEGVGGIDLVSIESIGGAEPKVHLDLGAMKVVENPMRIATSGTYEKTMAFLQALEKIPYIREVETLSFEGGTTKNGKRIIAMTLVMQVFVYERASGEK